MQKAYYRIHTEDKNLDVIIEECRNMLSCFALYHNTGFWKGNEEKGLTIEVLLWHTPHNDGLMKALAEAIKHINEQEASLLTIAPVHNSFML